MSGVIFLIVFVLINLWAILTKNDSNSFLAGIAGMCLVTGIMYLRKGKRNQIPFLSRNHQPGTGGTI